MKIKFLGALAALCLIGSTVSFAQTKYKPTSAKARLNAAIARGGKVYVQNCLSCHQADGAGVQNMNPPLIKTTYVLGDKTKLITIVLKGFNEDVEINDQTFSNTMAPHDFMTDQQIADVLTYVRNSFTNKASRVTVAEVKKVRASVVVKK